MWSISGWVCPRLCRSAGRRASEGLADLAEYLRAHAEARIGGGSAPAVLVHLQAYPGESVEAVRRVLGISQPATVRVVDRLAAEGLVERGPGPGRRSLALHLTAAGERAATDALGRRTRSLRALLDPLAPAEQAALVPLLSYVGYLGATALTGAFAARVGARRTAVTAGLLATVGMTAAGLSRSPGVFVVGIVVERRRPPGR